MTDTVTAKAATKSISTVVSKAAVTDSGLIPSSSCVQQRAYMQIHMNSRMTQEKNVAGLWAKRTVRTS